MAAKLKSTEGTVYGALYLELQELGTTGRYRPPTAFTVSLGVGDDFILLSSQGITTGVKESDLEFILDTLKKIYRVSSYKFTPSTNDGKTSSGYEEEFALDLVATLNPAQARVFLKGESRTQLVSYLKDLDQDDR
jgi:hypothetical protein